MMECFVQVCSLKFADGKAHFRSKYVKTTGYVMEKKAQKLLFKGSSLSSLPSACPADSPSSPGVYYWWSFGGQA